MPAELLATVAWVQSGMSMNLHPRHAHPGEAEHQPAAAGLMGIGSAELTRVEDAASLLTVPQGEVRLDPRTNVRAGAALLSDEARKLGIAPQQASEWSPALAAYGGDALVEATLRLLATGFSTVDDVGRSIEVVGSGVESDTLDTVVQGLGYPGAKWSAAHSSNYSPASRGASQIDFIVIHTTQGSYAGTISWFKNPSANVSSHYVVRSSDGEVTQMVDDSDIAWHDACFNTNTIGIEHEGYVDAPKKWYTQNLYQGSAKLSAWLCDKYGIPRDRKHILGHGEAPDCSTHTDPGSGWNWSLYMDLVKHGGMPDKDGDGVPDKNDNCVNVKNAGQNDTDKDGKGDACDGDDDGDGVNDPKDNCPKHKNAGQNDTDKDGKGDACDGDDDGDGVKDEKDNCPKVANKGQSDTDKDGKGDACDGDDDGDGVKDEKDNCPKQKNAAQTDTDKDGRGDACADDNDGDGVLDADDVCPKVSDPEQEDLDQDGKGDACDADDDGDGVLDVDDNCPGLENADQLDANQNGVGDVCDNDMDADGVQDADDVCPEVADPDQTDTDDDGTGDACDEDDDGDGVNDVEDACPTVAAGSSEVEGTGLGCDAWGGATGGETPAPSASGASEEGGCSASVASRAPRSKGVLLLCLIGVAFSRRRRQPRAQRASKATP